ncbi:hypothetical protein [Streptomyces sp. NPDC051219]|uniref:SCO6745 family protein n=1 Tax=Streptomyces sp. NPDC051219 TaxID=3155283 RepID=UPI00343B169B
MSTAWATAYAVKHYVRRLGGLFMKSAIAKQHARQLQLPGFAYYFGGRGSVLGEVDSDVVTATFGFFPAELVGEHWSVARRTAPPAQFRAHYLRTCHTWAAEHLGAFKEAEQLGALLEKVTSAASPTLLPLFAGWRSVPLPGDPAARVAQLAHVLREHRGGLHLCAVRACGITPVDAIRTREDGDRRAAFLGWRSPGAPPDASLVQLREHVERVTDDLTAPAYEVLDEAELKDLQTLLEAAYRHAVPS